MLTAGLTALGVLVELADSGAFGILTVVLLAPLLTALVGRLPLRYFAFGIGCSVLLAIACGLGAGDRGNDLTPIGDFLYAAVPVF